MIETISFGDKAHTVLVEEQRNKRLAHAKPNIPQLRYLVLADNKGGSQKISHKIWGYNTMTSEQFWFKSKQKEKRPIQQWSMASQKYQK